jgi:hypothetical protein
MLTLPLWSWRRQHNEELHNLSASPNINTAIKSRMRCAEYVIRMAEIRNAYVILVRIPENKRPSGRSRRRWEDNIMMDLR